MTLLIGATFHCFRSNICILQYKHGKYFSPQICIQRLLGLDIENKNLSPSYYMLISPWHISGSSFLRLTHTCSCLSCTCGQFQGPKDRQDLDPLTGNKLKATPKMSKINKVSNDTKIIILNSLTTCMWLAQNLSHELHAKQQI